MAQIDRINGQVGNLAIKVPVRAAATGNITLAGFQTVDGVAMADGDYNLRTLAPNQTDPSENGIYDMSSGSWSRSADFDGSRDVVKGTQVEVQSGSTYGGYFFTVSASDPIVIGTTSITFTSSTSAANSATAAAASAAAAAISEDNAAADAADIAANVAAAAASASAAASSENNAAQSAIEAEGEKVQAEAARVAAELAETNAETAEANAEAAALASGMPYVLSPSTVMDDPGAGLLRSNSAMSDPSMVMAFAISYTDNDARNLINFINTWDDSTNTIKSVLVLRNTVSNACAVFHVISLLDNTTWAQLDVQFVSTGGVFNPNDLLYLGVSRCGDAGSVTEAAIQTQTATRFTAGGTSDAITGTLSPAISSYTAGLRVTTKPGGANTVTGPTLNLSSLGAVTIKKRDSSGTKVALVPGDYNASGPFDFEYDGTDFILLNPIVSASPNVKLAGDTVQVVEGTPYTTYSSTSTAIPSDDTIPQNTEGAELATVTITPTDATSRLVIEATISIAAINNNYIATAALFMNSSANALAASSHSPAAADHLFQMRVRHEMAAGATSATTFKLRAGPSAGTMYINGNSSARRLGGVAAVRISVTEIKA